MVRKWISELPATEREDLLIRFLLGDEPQLRREIIRAIRRNNPCEHRASAERTRRTVGQLFSEWDRRVRENERRMAEKAARERARRKEEEARKRQAHLEDLAKRTTAMWKQVDSLIGERNAQSHDRAVTLLTDLRDASALTGKEAAFHKRLQDTVALHARKPTLIRRIEMAGLRRRSTGTLAES